MGRGVLPLQIEVDRHLAEASGGGGVVVGEQAAADLQRLLDEAVGRGVLPLVVEVYRQGVVAVGGVGVVVGEQAAADLHGFSCSGWAAAYFPWALRFAARPL